MKRLKFKLSLIIVIVFMAFLANAQDEKPPKTSFSGYLKYMPSLDLSNGLNPLIDNHLVHNRLNFSWYPKASWTVRVEMRNRIFFGDYVRLIPIYKELIDVNNDQFDLSTWIIDENGIKMLSEIDRAYIQYSKDSWEITAGRQRINWGINTVWNPNDIFNAYSFFDFDYEERPGSDAVNITYYYGFASQVSFASKFSTSFEDYTGAFLWKTNMKGYDIQFLGGLMEKNIVVGTGWAGNIKTAGFKGEVSYFYGLDSIQNALVGSISGDYVFGGGSYMLGSWFYNSSGGKTLEPGNLAVVSSTRPLNAKNLLPFEHAVLLQFSHPISPLFTASLATMYFPGVGGGYIGPAFSYSLANNISLDLIGQVFHINETGTSTQIFARAKWSF